MSTCVCWYTDAETFLCGRSYFLASSAVSSSSNLLALLLHPPRLVLLDALLDLRLKLGVVYQSMDTVRKSVGCNRGKRWGQRKRVDLQLKARKRNSRCEKNGARTTAIRTATPCNQPSEWMYRNAEKDAPCNRLSNNAGALPSAAPCPTNWDNQLNSWTTRASFIDPIPLKGPGRERVEEGWVARWVTVNWERTAWGRYVSCRRERTASLCVSFQTVTGSEETDGGK